VSAFHAGTEVGDTAEYPDDAEPEDEPVDDEPEGR
jgi:hypothetical protein